MRLRLALSIAILAAGCGDEARAVITPEPIELGQVAPRVTAAPSRVVSRIPALLAPHLGARPRVRRAVVLRGRGRRALRVRALRVVAPRRLRGELPRARRGRRAGSARRISRSASRSRAATTRCARTTSPSRAAWGSGLLKARVGDEALERTLDVRLPYLGCRLARVHAMELRELDGDAELELVLDVETETPNWTYTTRRERRHTQSASRARRRWHAHDRNDDRVPGRSP
ncbi:MAG: hypothetical protein M5U28_03200 [Sandaracinaceae bacterium]|nr:hypothetical protein [Sandaracinaceae bacterium]